LGKSKKGQLPISKGGQAAIKSIPCGCDAMRKKKERTRGKSTRGKKLLTTEDSMRTNVMQGWGLRKKGKAKFRIKKRGGKG